MFIQPSEYLDLTERIAILTDKYERENAQNLKKASMLSAAQEKAKFFQLRVEQLERQKLQAKSDIKQHITSKAQAVISHVSECRENQKLFIQQQIDKVRNWSAINTLKQLDEKIMENKSSSYEKQFYEKVKTLYVIQKKKTKCNSYDLFDWVNQLVKFKKNIDNNDPLNDISKILGEGTQKSINIKPNNKKNKKSQKKLSSKSRLENSQVKQTSQSGKQNSNYINEASSRHPLQKILENKLEN